MRRQAWRPPRASSVRSTVTGRSQRRSSRVVDGHDTRTSALSLDDKVVKDADKLTRYGAGFWTIARLLSIAPDNLAGRATAGDRPVVLSRFLSLDGAGGTRPETPRSPAPVSRTTPSANMHERGGSTLAGQCLIRPFECFSVHRRDHAHIHIKFTGRRLALPPVRPLIGAHGRKKVTIRIAACVRRSSSPETGSWSQ